MITLPVPPIVAQQVALLPDGTVDPQSQYDCGEACMTSVMSSLRHIWLSPGCFRQALHGAGGSGITTMSDLAWLCRSLGLYPAEHSGDAGTVWALSQMLRHHGRYALVLGAWIFETDLHWMVAYQADGRQVFFADPWTGSYVTRTQTQFGSQRAQAALYISP